MGRNVSSSIVVTSEKVVVAVGVVAKSNPAPIQADLTLDTPKVHGDH